MKEFSQCPLVGLQSLAPMMRNQNNMSSNAQNQTAERFALHWNSLRGLPLP